jgi:hypothetical protein
MPARRTLKVRSTNYSNCLLEPFAREYPESEVEDFPRLQMDFKMLPSPVKSEGEHLSDRTLSEESFSSAANIFDTKWSQFQGSCGRINTQMPKLKPAPKHKAFKAPRWPADRVLHLNCNRTINETIQLDASPDAFPDNLPSLDHVLPMFKPPALKSKALLGGRLDHSFLKMSLNH